MLETARWFIPIMKRIRQFHLWLGIFYAPVIVFFAFTGALQTLGLHEANPSTGQAPHKWIATLSQIHKNQRFHKPTASEARDPGTLVVVLKYFAVLMAAGLIVASFLGIYMAFRYNRDKRLVCGPLIAGTVIPVVLLICASRFP